MTPNELSRLIDLALIAGEVSASLLEDYQASKATKTVADRILDRVIAQLEAPVSSRSHDVSMGPTGSWHVAGLERAFPSQHDADIASQVLALVQLAESLAQGRETSS